MCRVIISHLQKRLTQVLVGLLLVISTVMGGLVYPLSAQAVPLTPEARSYQVDGSDRGISISPNKVKDDVTDAGSNVIDSVKGSAKSLGETVKEKLNLDEPLPESTRLFGKQLRGEKVVVPEPKPSGKDDTYGVGD